MIFTPTKLDGVYVVEIEKVTDERGFFARSWDVKQFADVGLNTRIVQCSVSNNTHKGTIRGMHYQSPPYQETKIVRCTRGRLYDVVIDLRKHSPTFKQWISVDLTEDNYKMVFVPEGCAHGYQTLEDNTSVAYQMSEIHMPEYYTGVRWNDEVFNILWPLKVTVISKNDLNWPNYIS